MECLGFQRLLEISLAASQICDPIRASLMKKCSLTQRENEAGRGEHVKWKREVEREKERKKPPWTNKFNLLESASSFQRGRQEIASNNSHSCPNSDYEWARSSFALSIQGNGVTGMPFQCSERPGKATHCCFPTGRTHGIKYMKALGSQALKKKTNNKQPPGSQALC